MALLDIFKKNKEGLPKKKTVVKKNIKTASKKTDEVDIKPKKSIKILKYPSFNILKEPYITEKATDLEKDNKYVFRVFSKSNKKEIKKAVEGLYKVDVINVKIINVPAKKRRVGRRTEGWRKGYKKAVVKIKNGQKIEMLSR